jgi:hypothetical protein
MTSSKSSSLRGLLQDDTIIMSTDTIPHNNQESAKNLPLSFDSAKLRLEKETLEQIHWEIGITKPHPNDVLLGRWAQMYTHPGTQYFRSLVKHLKNEYVVAAKSEKLIFAKLIVKNISAQKPPGRFLKQQHKNKKLWDILSQKKVLESIRSALREDAKAILSEIEEGKRHVETNVRGSISSLLIDTLNQSLSQSSNNNKIIDKSVPNSIHDLGIVDSIHNPGPSTGNFTGSFDRKVMIPVTTPPAEQISVSHQTSIVPNDTEPSPLPRVFARSSGTHFCLSASSKRLPDNGMLDPQNVNDCSKTAMHLNVPYAAGTDQTSSIDTSLSIKNQCNNLEVDGCDREVYLRGNYSSYCSQRQADISRVQNSSDDKEEFDAFCQRQCRMNASTKSIGSDDKDFPYVDSSHLINHHKLIPKSMYKKQYGEGESPGQMNSKSQRVMNSGSIRHHDDNKEEFMGSDNYHASQYLNVGNTKEILVNGSLFNLPTSSIDMHGNVEQDFPTSSNGLKSNEQTPSRGSCDYPVSKSRHSIILRNSSHHADLHTKPSPINKRSSAVMAEKFFKDFQGFNESCYSKSQGGSHSKRRFRDSNRSLSPLLRDRLRNSLTLDDIFKPDNKRVDRRGSIRTSSLPILEQWERSFRRSSFENQSMIELNDTCTINEESKK